VAVSYDRPYDSETGAGQFFVREVAAVRFLEREGYPVSYTTIDSIDGAPGQVRGARVLLDVGHSEYWSRRARDAFLGARESGASLIFMSSDTMAWGVRFEPAGAASSEAGARGHVMVAYKEHAAEDPALARRATGPPTGLFPLGGADLVGSAYDGCVTPRRPGPGPPVYRYYAWSPTPNLQPAWLFAGTDITARTRIPGVVGYELDERTPAAPAGTAVVGGSEGAAGTAALGGGAGTAAAGGAVGASCMPESEPSPARGRIAQSTIYTAPSGALVFATGTLGWEYALSPVPQASPDVPRAPDPRVVAMTRNLLARALGTASPR
jgi:hypothetical protein